MKVVTWAYGFIIFLFVIIFFLNKNLENLKILPKKKFENEVFCLN